MRGLLPQGVVLSDHTAHCGFLVRLPGEERQGSVALPQVLVLPHPDFGMMYGTVSKFEKTHLTRSMSD